MILYVAIIIKNGMNKMVLELYHSVLLRNDTIYMLCGFVQLLSFIMLCMSNKIMKDNSDSQPSNSHYYGFHSTVYWPDAEGNVLLLLQYC